MEEFDELLPTPDAEGKLELSHRAWLDVDEIVWTMGLEVITLSLAYNRLKHIAYPRRRVENAPISRAATTEAGVSGERIIMN